jgi:hypothetical protein
MQLSRILKAMLSHPAILERLIAPQQGDFSPELASYVLAMDFPPSDHRRYADLASKAQSASLTPDERSELEDYLSVDELLTLLRSKARASLHRRNPAA